MSLQSGARLGPYAILSVLGAGGMGEVYRATDTNLGRQVAIKVLPETFAGDADRLARFEREARLLASLNHPHIAAIYGLERADARTALVMELVEGPTLADRIARGPIPIDEVLSIAGQTAEALEAAHEQGIVHRDLKPANIKLRPDGTVKVLDFGLATAETAKPGSSLDVTSAPTLTSPAMTQAGMILGTAAYMAPEQARGRIVDKRADVWAFGVVLFEMITGRRPFEGDDMSDTLAAVLRSEPDWSLLSAKTPPAIVGCVKRCLQRDPRQRIRDIGDARLALAGAFEAPPAAVALASPAPGGGRSGWLATAAVLIALVAGAAAWVLRPSPAAEDRPVARFAIPLAAGPDGLGVMDLYLTGAFTLSSDERTVVYTRFENDRTRFFRRAVADLDGVPISGTENAVQPVLSPDQRWLGFFTGSDRTLKKMDASGGVPVVVTSVPGVPHGAAWLSDGTIVFGQHMMPLMRVSEAGGVAEPLLSLAQGEEDQGYPVMVPGERAIVFGSYPAETIDVYDFRSRTRQSLTSGSFPRVTRDGRLVFLREGSIWAAPFDLDRLVLTGDPQPVVSHPTPGLQIADFVLGGRGTLVYRTSPAADALNQFAATWVTREGREESLSLPARPYESPRLSPDGQRLAVSVPSERPNENDLWVYDLRTGAGVRLTRAGHNRVPVWTADGSRIVFSSTLNAVRPPGSTQNWYGNLYDVRADGSREPERLTNAVENHALSGISPDGRHLFFTRVIDAATQWEITRVDRSRDGEIAPLMTGAVRRGSAEVSPDGRLISYRSDETGRFQIYVQTYPDLDAKIAVSVEGGDEPVWSVDSRELYYRLGDRVMAVEIRRQPTLQASAPQQLFEGPYRPGGGGGRGREYHVAPDGRFLMLKPLSAAAAPGQEPHLVVVLNWQEELRARLP